MKLVSRLGLVAAVMAITSADIAAAQARKPCLTPPEFEAIVTFGLPDIVTSVAQRCSPVLAPAAFLTVRSTALVARYRPDAEAAWPATRSVLAKLYDPTLMKLIGDKAVRNLVTASIAAEIPKRIKPSDCGRIDAFGAALEPLPARNLARLIGLVGSLNSSGMATDPGSPFALCPTPDSAPVPVPPK